MSTSGNVIAKERIKALLDDNSFVEIGALVSARSTDFNIKSTDTPSDGIVTGYGLIDGKLVFVYSQDPQVLGGSVGEMHAKKIINIYDKALKMGAPVIGLVDSAGIRIQESFDGLAAFGRVYKKMSIASGIIPQIMAVFGNCGGGMAVMTQLADFTFMESEKARLFVNAPNTIDGNKVESCDTSSADFQAAKSGNADFVGSEAEVYAGVRQLVNILPANDEEEEFLYDSEDDLNRSTAGIEGFAGDTLMALTLISDDNLVVETKKDYAPDMVTAFIKLNGATIGAIANRTEILDENGDKKEEFDPVLSAKGCKKAADFVRFCDAFSIPVLTLTNVSGYKTTKCCEKKLADYTSKLVYAFTSATVPKVNLIVGKAIGTAYLAMNSKSTGADMVYAWPQAKAGIMDAKNAAKIMYADEIDKADDKGAKIAEFEAEYNKLQGSVNAAAARGYIDAIIEPADTRKYLIGAFEMLYTKLDYEPDKKHGTV